MGEQKVKIIRNFFARRKQIYLLLSVSKKSSQRSRSSYLASLLRLSFGVFWNKNFHLINVSFDLWWSECLSNSRKDTARVQRQPNQPKLVRKTRLSEYIYTPNFSNFGEYFQHPLFSISWRSSNFHPIW